MKRYPKYKDSGIQWLGQIPEHWDLRRAKYMFQKNKRERRPEDEVITCFRDGQVTLRKNRRTTGFTESEKYDGYQGIRKGDLVIHQMDAFAGSIGVSDSDGMGTSVYHCCTPLGDYNVYYYAYLIRQMALSGYIQSLYKGIRERSSDFSFPIFGKQFLAIPPLDEQEKIVEYIDSKTNRIDAYVVERERELQTLHELKQSQIAEVVTRGLNPNVPLKDSGIPWIGMIPEHWEMRKAKYIFEPRKIVVGEKSSEYDLLSLTLNGVRKRDMENPTGKFPSSFDTYQEVHVGDFIFCLFDNEETPRTVGLSRYDGMITGAYNVFECNKEDILPEYVLYYYLTIDTSKHMKPLYRGLRKTIPYDAFMRYRVPVPPIEEQRAIVEHINTKCNHIDTMIANLESEIAYLKEYKQRMIADAVTGAINVQ